MILKFWSGRSCQANLKQNQGLLQYKIMYLFHVCAPYVLSRNFFIAWLFQLRQIKLKTTATHFS